MPDLRILTWNSSGEADGRGAALANVTNHINGGAAGTVPVQVVAIQEAQVSNGGSIQATLAGTAPFSTSFGQPQGFSREHLPTQTQPVTPSRAYRLSYMATNAVLANNLVAVGAPTLVNLSPTADAGVNAYITGLHAPFQQDRAIRLAAANLRYPLYQAYTYAGGTVHFFTWHVDHAANWRNAIFLNYTNYQGPAYFEAFVFFQNSTFYANMMTNLGPNDVVIIGGDLNMTPQDAQQPGIFNNFVGVSNNLDHILAFSLSANLAVNQGVHYAFPNFGPHDILSARVQW